MRYFIDTEYIWDHKRGRLEPVSIGIVAEDGCEFYAVSTEFNARHANQWVKDNVLSKLPERHPSSYDSPRIRMEALAWMPLREIREAVARFIGDDTPEFWGDYAAFDYVVLSMIMGDFKDWPNGWPMYINDLQQAGMNAGPPEVPHNSLSDAQAIHRALMKEADGNLGL